MEIQLENAMDIELASRLAIVMDTERVSRLESVKDKSWENLWVKLWVQPSPTLVYILI